MTSIDAWVADWEIGCCRSVPAPGERWSAVLVFDGGVTPSAAERIERLPSGAVRLAGPVEQRLSGEGVVMAVPRCGPIYVFVHDPPEGERFEGEGRLYEDNHFDYIDEAAYERWKATGRVRRLWVVPGNRDADSDWPDVADGLLRGVRKRFRASIPDGSVPSIGRRGLRSKSTDDRRPSDR